MKQEKMVENLCQFCKHSMKNYVGIGDKISVDKAIACFNRKLKIEERSLRFENKCKCEYFVPTERPTAERVSDIQECLDTIKEQVRSIEAFLHWNEMIKDITDEEEN